MQLVLIMEAANVYNEAGLIVNYAYPIVPLGVQPDIDLISSSSR